VEIINKEGVLIMKIYVLEYDFTVYTVNLEAKETKRKREFFDKIEDLIAEYREKKEALFMGFIKYNNNFKIYEAKFYEMDISAVDVLL
jgi:hypothetical protein